MTECEPLVPTKVRAAPWLTAGWVIAQSAFFQAAHSTISILSSAAINFQHVIPRPEILLAERLSATRDHGPTASTR
jgi:hypothetical protein